MLGHASIGADTDTYTLVLPEAAHEAAEPQLVLYPG